MFESIPRNTSPDPSRKRRMSPCWQQLPTKLALINGPQFAAAGPNRTRVL